MTSVLRGRTPPAIGSTWRRARGRGWPAAGTVVALTAVCAALSALWMPRGPVTTAQALTAMGTSLAVGLLGGWWLRSRWSMLLVPATFAAVFELVRLPTDGPLVDGIVLTSPYGLIAFVLGRGLHGLLTLLPLLLGSALGAGLARRTARHGEQPARTGRTTRVARRFVAVGLAVLLLALTAAIARPAGTDTIADQDGEALAGSVSELTRVSAGDHELNVMLRGTSSANPVLLYLAGGPGGSELGAMRRHGQALEQDFVVATLDQRGTGASYDQLEPISTLTLEHAVADVITVTRHLRERFGQDVVVVGQSWGTLLGVLAVQQHPELFRAYVGVGQMVDPLATDAVFYADTLAWAKRTGNTALTDTLLDSGPPPYDDVLDYEAALSYEQEVYPYDHSGNAEGAGGFSENLLVREYSFLQQAHALAAFMDVFTVLYPQLQRLDLRRQVPALQVPVFLAQGHHEAPGRAGPAAQWFQQLAAPLKTFVEFDRSGHRPLFEQPDEFHRLMVDVLART